MKNDGRFYQMEKMGKDCVEKASGETPGYAKYRCNKCKKVFLRKLGWKTWTPSFCEELGKNARLYRITAPVYHKNDLVA